MKRRGLAKEHAAVEHEVWQWKKNLEEKRGGQRVTKADIQTFALEAYGKAGITGFKASDGWYRRWRLRWQQPETSDSKDRSEDENIKSLDITAANKIHINISEVKTNKQKKSKQCPTSSKKAKKVTTNKLNLLKTTATHCLDPVEECKSITSRDVSSFDRLEPQRDLITIGIERSNTEVNQLTGPAENLLRCSKLPLERNNGNVVSATIITNSIVPPNNKTIEQISVAQNHKTKTKVSDDSLSNDGIFFNIDNYLTENDACSKPATNQNGVDENGICNPSDSVLVSCHVENLSQEESVSKSQLDSSMPSSGNCTSATDTYQITSPLFDQSDLHFGDHDLYCDSCEDFHPRRHGILCSKQDKDFSNNSLLSCVFEKRRSLSESSSCGKPAELNTNKSDSKNEPNDVNLVNPTVIHPKGRRYLGHFKDQVVSYSEKNSIQLAAEKFKVNRNSVSEWLAEHRRALGGNPSGPGVKEVTDSSVSDFFNWLEGSKYYLTNEALQQKASEWLHGQEGVGKPCRWLYMYANRICHNEDNSMKKRYIPYPTAFKRVVVFYAQTHSNLAASRVFGVSRRRIIEWQNISKSSQEKNEDHHATSCVTNSEVDKKVLEWYQKQIHPPSSKQVRTMAVELYRSAGYGDIQCGSNWYYRWRARHRLPTARSQRHTDLQLLSWVLIQLDNNRNVTHSALVTKAMALNGTKISRGWTYRFCRKHNWLLSVLPEPTVPPIPPLEMKIGEFRKSLLTTVMDRGFTDVNIIAMDEVPLQFIHKESSKKQQLLWQPGFKTCQATLIVSCLSNGIMLPSMFVFKDSGLSSKPDPLVSPVTNALGLVTEDVMAQWLQNICFKQLPDDGGVLITDCYDVHVLESIKKACSERLVQQAATPGGCGFWLLPVISLCQRFKLLMEKKCSEWLNSQSVTEGLKPPSSDQLYAWALRIHKHLAKNQTEIMKTAFKTKLFPPSTPAEPQ